jgi:hypothetical protein
LQGPKDLKTAKGTPVDIFQDPNTGKSYMVYRPIRTMAGVVYNTDEAKQTGTDLTNRMIEIPSNDLGFFGKTFNPPKYKNKVEEFPATTTGTKERRKESLSLAADIFKDAPVNKKK